MQQRLPSLYQQPILFAHRGASAHAPENSIDAFRLALRLGATGLETDCWVTKDKHVVLDHDGVVRQKRFSRVRSKKIGECEFSEIQSKMPKLTDLLEIATPNIPISIDLCDPTAMPIIDQLVDKPESMNRIFICHPDLELLASLKQQYPLFRYVNSIRLRKISEGPERRCANLAEFKIDVLKATIHTLQFRELVKNEKVRGAVRDIENDTFLKLCISCSKLCSLPFVH